ncbi:hypothetical protein [Algoriphagus limi]|uniref:Uncharacterized protein n=1 Tax=Algoriphagus limi TaxID=2975273 RepID=A0ABT2G4C0_9BACT|nr:hypothetical protein [Algoriphagus limi]MCS5489291.1 hypothetical protein [Algoriphagus limi]
MVAEITEIQKLRRSEIINSQGFQPLDKRRLIDKRWRRVFGLETWLGASKMEKISSFFFLDKKESKSQDAAKLPRANPTHGPLLRRPTAHVGKA